MASRHHTFRIPDGLWLAAMTRARAEGSTVTAEVLRFLTWYGKGTPRPTGPGDSDTGGNHGV